MLKRMPHLMLSLLLLSFSSLSVQASVLQLTDATFEGATQASTGQTTGHWCDMTKNYAVVMQYLLTVTSPFVQASLVCLPRQHQHRSIQRHQIGNGAAGDRSLE